MDAIAAFVAHVEVTRYEDLPDAAIDAAKTFILDTLGVGLLGSSGPRAADLVKVQRASGTGSEAVVWGHGAALPAASAALCNAFQTHSCEFDCVHEEAVVHAMTAVLAAALAGAERMGGVHGRDLILAVVLGVDVAASLGLAAETGLKFFRPATAGAFGATAALGKLMGFDEARLLNAFSLVYGQVSGTMQAHTEGSMLLALQMGFNARNAVVACDLAAAGFDGPRNILEGPFGYFRLIETRGDPQRIAAALGRAWRVTELAHKPFPTGRATHGVVEGCLRIRRAPGFEPDAIERITARVPPLVEQLVGRRWLPDMGLNYARLCLRFVAARALMSGSVRPEDFSDIARVDAATGALASRITIEVRDAGDPNALVPVEVESVMRDGTRHIARIERVLGNPANPLDRGAQLAKFRTNAAAALAPRTADLCDRLIASVESLESIEDVRGLVALLGGRR